jgi:Putative zinc-finger
MRTLPIDLRPTRRKTAQAVCLDASKRALLFPYVARVATEVEQRAFERHILECEVCYDDVLAAWRVAELLEQFAVGVDAPGALPELLRRTRRRSGVRLILAILLAAVVGFALGVILV